MKRFCAWCQRTIRETEAIKHVFWRERAFCGPECLGSFETQVWYQRHPRLRPIPYPVARPPLHRDVGRARRSIRRRGVVA
ncbi:MAG: hypothetical protein HY558_06455 [Euryarchaeota archaeon]|nr:hypothetical protein [Euryarchaeota archaeon]